MEGKWTPGPWIVSGRGIWVETFPECGGPDPQPPEGEQIGVFASEADAVLAGSAPEMLEALQLAQASLSRLLNRDSGNPAVELNALRRARAAIAKATGEES